MTIEKRLENVERELGRVTRRNRWTLGAILVLVLGLTAAGMFKSTVVQALAQGPETVKDIRARSIIIEDENGITRVALGALKGDAYLHLHDKEGKALVELSVMNNGPRLVLCDGKKIVRAGLAVADGSPGLILFDHMSRKRAGLVVAEAGPGLLLADENGTIRFTAGAAASEMPDGKRIEYPESSLILYGPDGEAIWRAIN